MTECVRAGEDEMERVNESLREEIAADLGMSARQLDADVSFFKLGMDSMRLMAWMNRLRKRGHKVKLRDLYRQPTLKGWSRLLRECPAIQAETQSPAAARSSSQTWPTMADGEPFALTPVQHAYLVGRSPRRTLGGVGCHLYQEFNGAGLNVDALERAIGTLIKRHPLMMATFLDDGRQQRHPGIRWRGLTRHDLRTASPDECEAHLRAMRERHGHRVLAVERGENFDFQLTLLPDDRHRLHANIDLLVLDAASFSLLFDELAALIRSERLPLASEDYDFRSYLAQLAHENKAARRQARQFWMERLNSLPDSPHLPLAREPEQIKRISISRRRVEIQARDWARFKACANEHGVTPTMALVTCFGAVLSRWCGQPRLLLNLTLFDRQPLNPAVNGMIADFTNILLLDIAGEGARFDALAQLNQRTFTDVHEHRHWSGVELLRELRKTSDAYPHGAPVVFTSNLGRPLFGRDTERTLGAPGWGISQTPQVWVDHLAYEHGGSIFLQWDCNEALFPPGLLDAMFQAYAGLVRHLLARPRAWHEDVPDLMSREQRAVRMRINAHGNAPAPEGLLHDGFWRQARACPDAVALIHGERRLTYGELARQARCSAGAFVAEGLRPGDRVAISMSRGIGQIVAALGILYAGAVYVPVSLDQPLDRRRAIYQDAGTALVLICRGDAMDDVVEGATFLAWQDAIEHSPLSTPPVVDAREPAYIIYTSGSTGMPKGVIISHRGALNTCVDMNRRYAVTADDRVLALSALHFDLSVYDIFGLLSAGGALVLVDERQRRDPVSWCEAIERHGVTIWNSVPTLFDMLLTHSEGFESLVPAKLRTVMLSGDWIGLDLPARYRAFRPDGKFVAMGGATEASIWSNVYDVEEVEPDWRSIPYGYPLTRQKYRVADARGRDCPDWVPGELWIGGEGVALGYFNDSERTARQFVTLDGERWYRTGDMGRYWPDGRLEFLGRRDKQVKIGGYRIELGEIEAALLRVEGVKSAVVLAVGEREKSLAAFVVPLGTALYSALPANPALPADYAALVPREVVAAEQPEPDREAGMSRLVAGFLYDHLIRQGVDLFTDITARAALGQYGAQSRWAGLMDRWLNHLCAEGFLQRLADGRYGPVAEEPPSWQPIGGHPLWETAGVLLSHHTPVAQILRGERLARTLLDHPFWAPEHLLLRAPGAQTAIEAQAGTVRALAKALGRPVRLHEVGARSGVAAARLLQHLDISEVEYTAWDESPEMVLRAAANLRRYAHADVRRWHPNVSHEVLHKADVVWANNALHRLGDDGIRAVLALAAPSALVCVHELRRVSSLALVSAELLADEGNLGMARRLHETLWWRAMLGAHDMRGEADGLVGDLQWLILRAPGEVLRPDSAKLAAALLGLLPSHMVPRRLFFLDALLVTANGKIDHRALLRHCDEYRREVAPERELPQGDTERAVATLWHDLLKAGDIHRDSHFFRLGGDSLLATRLIGELGRRGYEAGLGDLFDFPTLAAFAATVRRGVVNGGDGLRHDPANLYEPFPLTDVQQAYLVGRRPGFPLGGVGSHFFVEFEVADLDVARFEQAMNRLIQRHNAMRTVVRDGMQQVLREVPRFSLPCHPVTDLDGEQAIALRERLARQVLDPSRWPVFDIQAAQVVRTTRALLFVCLDNLMLDGLSMQILLAELEQLYINPQQVLSKIEIGFRDYSEHMKLCKVNEVSQAYWTRRLDSLPPAPRLPLIRDPADVGVPRFARLSAHISAPQWNMLKARAHTEGLTPSALLLTAYAATLSAWAERDEMCLNLTLFDRQPLHPQIEQVLGDFTTLLLLAWQPAGDWRGSVHQLQRRLRHDLLYRDVSAIQVMRQIAQRTGRVAATMPVVFTSALGFDRDRFLAHASWMKPRWGLSHTPQIWLDHQVYESEGELRFNWDYVQELFEQRQIRTMFDRHIALLLRLATDDAAWDMPLDALVPRLEGVNRSPRAVPDVAVALPQSTRPEVIEPHADDALAQALCRHFELVVGRAIQPRQSFFDAGATSLKLVQLHVHLTQVGHGGLLVTDLFAHATPLALAMHLHGSSTEATNAIGINEERRELLEQRKARLQRRYGSAS